MPCLSPVCTDAVTTRYTYGDGQRHQAGRAGRQCHRPLRGRLWRRHAADRRALYERDRRARERPLDLPGFPRRDPGAGWLSARRLRFSGPLRRPRHPDPGRRAERACRDEPGGAEDKPARPAARRDADRRPGHLYRAQPRQSRLRRQPARGRLARRVRRPRSAADVDDARGDEGSRGRHEARGRAREEHVRARADVLALPPPDRQHGFIPRAQVREAP